MVLIKMSLLKTTNTDKNYLKKYCLMEFEPIFLKIYKKLTVPKKKKANAYKQFTKPKTKNDKLTKGLANNMEN